MFHSYLPVFSFQRISAVLVPFDVTLELFVLVLRPSLSQFPLLEMLHGVDFALLVIVVSAFLFVLVLHFFGVAVVVLMIRLFIYSLFSFLSFFYAKKRKNKKSIENMT